MLTIKGCGDEEMDHETFTLLIVDDSIFNQGVLRKILEEDAARSVAHAANPLYSIRVAGGGEEALRIAESDKLDLILLDIVMPVMDGFDVLRAMNASGIIKTVPVILITGETGEDKSLAGYDLGVSDLVNKPFNPDIVYKRVSNVIDLYTHKQNLEQKLLEQREMLEKQSLKLRQTNLFVIDALSTAVEFRNGESGEHIKRIRLLTHVLLEEMSAYYPMTQEEIATISSASAMHDIGKIAIPDSILLKPGRLTAEEFEIMKAHTIHGCNILEDLNYMQDAEYYRYCYDICRHHHERWDGRGYPDGLKGDEISVAAQATSIADVYDALSSKRVYKEAYSHDKTIQMILNGECGAFNPKLLECLKNAHERLLEVI